MIRYQQEVAKLIHGNLENCPLSQEEILKLLERPQRSEHGDIAFPCFQLAKLAKKAPPQIATELASKLTNTLPESLSKAVALGPYLNFHLSPQAAAEILSEVLSQKKNYGNLQTGAGQKILIEYSSPNVAKELHIGHFRNTILGQALNNIYQAAGYQTVSINHLGDWGSQFGKVAYGFLHYGNEDELKKNPLEYLTKLYVRVNQEEEQNPAIEKEARLLFKKIEDKDPELTKLWQKFCAVSIDGLKQTYERLGVRFDHYIGESFYVDKIDALLAELKQKSLLELSEGAQVVKLGEDEPPCLILTGDGTSLYATRDLAAALWRYKEFHFHACLYVVGSEQQLHLRQVFAVLKKMGHGWSERLHHVHYGLYRFKDGKFSTRKGKVILAAEVMDEAKQKALDLIEAKNPNLAQKEKIAEEVGLGAVVFNDLSTDRIRDVEFDWEKILDFEGDTGPYLQYSHARSCSILRQAKAKGHSPLQAGTQANKTFQELAKNEHAAQLMKQFAQLSPSLVGAVRLNKPSIIANYTLDLAKSFNSFYRNLKVLDESAGSEQIAARLALVDAFRQVAEKCLHLLCMKAPEEM